MLTHTLDECHTRRICDLYTCRWCKGNATTAFWNAHDVFLAIKVLFILIRFAEKWRNAWLMPVSSERKSDDDNQSRACISLRCTLMITWTLNWGLTWIRLLLVVSGCLWGSAVISRPESLVPIRIRQGSSTETSIDFDAFRPCFWAMSSCTPGPAGGFAQCLLRRESPSNTCHVTVIRIWLFLNLILDWWQIVSFHWLLECRQLHQFRYPFWPRCFNTDKAVVHIVRFWCMHSVSA